MLVARYRHRLPADYPMDRIRRRITERGPDWDARPGLVFKAFAVEDRAGGAAANAYSSLYLWRDMDAATDFLTGRGFQSVVESFGRPSIETWLTFDLKLGAAASAAYLAEEAERVRPEHDLGRLRETERNSSRTVAARPGVLATLVGLDPASWRLTRFTLQVEATEAGSDAEIAFLAAPGLAALRDAHSSVRG